MTPTNKTSRPEETGGEQKPSHDTIAEQAREREESRKAHDAEASNRERMVEIGRGNQQAGRQSS
jgi:hypothetical protein